jgi:hypothetical protein
MAELVRDREPASPVRDFAAGPARCNCSGPVWVTKSHFGELSETAEVPQIADGIAAVPKTSGSCHEETHVPQQIALIVSQERRYGKGLRQS